MKILEGQNRTVVGPVGHYNIRGANPGGNWISFVRLDEEGIAYVMGEGIPEGEDVIISAVDGEPIGERTIPFAAHSPSGSGIRNYKFEVPVGYGPVLNNSVLLMPYKEGDERSESLTRKFRDKREALPVWLDAWR